MIEGLTAPYSLDPNGSGGYILNYILEDIPSEDFSNKDKLNLRKKKLVLCCYYNPHNNFIETHMDSFGKVIDLLSTRYENFILIGDFNADESDNTIKDFCNI